MGEARKLAAILVADVAGFSRLAGADEERTLARLRALRSEVIDPAAAAHNGRVVKGTGDGFIAEFRSVVDAVRCAIEMQKRTGERNAGVSPQRRIEFRMGLHLGDVVEEADGDLMGDGVNIAARLEGVGEPGTICLSEDAYRQVKGRLHLAVTDLGPTQLKNIAEPIRVYSLQVGKRALAKPPPPSKSTPPRLSIVVLPFANIGGDLSHEHFVDGVTESLTTDLSRIRGSFVIGRNTAFTYKGRAVDLKQTGRELNVRYVLEGSVQRGENRMRVNVQLIDAETGSHLWAERFDKPLTDLFEMQDEIVARLAGTVDAELIAAEARRAEQAPNPDSIDLFFQGLAWFNKAQTPDSVARARTFFDRALIADPDNVEALVGSARADVAAAGLSFVADPIATFGAAEAKLLKALSIVPDHARGHAILGAVYIWTKRAAQGITQCEHALALDRNLAAANSTIALGMIFIGRAEEAESFIIEALRLSPRDTLGYIWMTFAGISKGRLGRWEQAAAWCRRAIEANPNHPLTYFTLGLALAQLGQAYEAESAVKAGLALNPSFTVARARATYTPVSDDTTYLAQTELVLEGFRKAGVPEG